MTRPSQFEGRRRTARFLEFVAAGIPLHTAARKARLDAERALRLVNDRDAFDEQIAAIRASQEVPDALHGAEPSADETCAAA